MINRTLTLLAGLLILGSAPLAAADGKLVLGGAILTPHGDALDLTRQSMRGWAFHAGYEVQPETHNASFLFYLGHVKLPGKKNAEPVQTYDLAANVAGVDMIFKPFDRMKALSIFTGPSIHQWQVEKKNIEGYAGMGQQDWRLGWRMGMGYDLDAAWKVTLSFTQTEWRSNANEEYVPGLNPSRPAYWSMAAHYRF